MQVLEMLCQKRKGGQTPHIVFLFVKNRGTSQRYLKPA